MKMPIECICMLRPRPGNLARSLPSIYLLWGFPFVTFTSLAANGRTGDAAKKLRRNNRSRGPSADHVNARLCTRGRRDQLLGRATCALTREARNNSSRLVFRPGRRILSPALLVLALPLLSRSRIISLGRISRERRKQKNALRHSPAPPFPRDLITPDNAFRIYPKTKKTSGAMIACCVCDRTRARFTRSKCKKTRATTTTAPGVGASVEY